MAQVPPHICAKCRRVVTGRCPRCAARRERERGTAHQRGYTAAWSEYSRQWLRRYPWCGQRQDGLLHVEHSECARRGLRVRADVTDHILAMRQGGAQFDPGNHQSLCRGCNARKAIKFEGGFGR